MEQIQSKSRLTPLRITLIYFFAGVFWIFTSDKLLAIFVHNENALLYLETFKGWFYVLVTACMLYVLIQRSISTIERGREVLHKSMTELGERIKELNCLYSISELIEKRQYILEEILHGVVELLPPGWQYPGITCARIVIDSAEFKTNNFVETKWRQACDVLLKGEPIGTLEVYISDRIRKPIFLKCQHYNYF